MYKSKFFKPAEFACNCGCGAQDVAELLLQELDAVREHFGVPITVTSGVRCDEWNIKQGGAGNSQHLLGNAADIKVKGVSPFDVYQYLNQKFSKKYGIGLYGSFVHFDVRSQKARW